MKRHLRIGVLAGCLLAAALAAYFFAPAANRAPATQGEAGTPAAPAKSLPPGEAPGLAAGAPIPGTDRSRATPSSGAEKAASSSPRAVKIVGKVVAERDTPSPGATVELRIGERVEGATSTDANGGFSFEVERPEGDPPPGLLAAHDAAGRVASRAFGWRNSQGPFVPVEAEYPKTLDVGALALFPAAVLDVVVVDRAARRGALRADRPRERHAGRRHDRSGPGDVLRRHVTGVRGARAQGSVGAADQRLGTARGREPRLPALRRGRCRGPHPRPRARSMEGHREARDGRRRCSWSARSTSTARPTCRSSSR